MDWNKFLAKPITMDRDFWILQVFPHLPVSKIITIFPSAFPIMLPWIVDYFKNHINHLKLSNLNEACNEDFFRNVRTLDIHPTHPPLKWIPDLPVARFVIPQHLTVLKISNMGLQSLQDILYPLTKLEFLDCHKNNLMWLDTSRNTKLKTLLCHCNLIQTIQLNPEIIHLNCSFNKLNHGTLDLTLLQDLQQLNCSSNGLCELNLSQNVALDTVICECNRLVSLDVSENTVLEKLNCRYNELTCLSFPYLLNGKCYLSFVDCSKNKLQGTFDFSKCENLRYFRCIDNPGILEFVLPEGMITFSKSRHQKNNVTESVFTIDSRFQINIHHDSKTFISTFMCGEKIWEYRKSSRLSVG